MTPAARYAAAIDILDMVSAEKSAEKCLAGWARNNRFAGSKDRAAIRDHVYDVLRAKRSLAALGGGTSGRNLILGLLLRNNIAPDTVFGAGGYGPAALGANEQHNHRLSDTLPQPVEFDLPDWLWPLWQDSLGADAETAAMAQQSRAPVFLRVNLRRGTRETAQAILAEDGIVSQPHPMVFTTLEVTENERKVSGSRAYTEGLVELQDASSQMAVAALDFKPGLRVLDYCAGGGGKALALADMYDADVSAHDVAPQRMVDIPKRAARAGVSITILSAAHLKVIAPFDVVFCDAPCSGSGTWRRTPEAKWQLTESKLRDYNTLQEDALAKSARFVAAGGLLVYATCSVLKAENDDILNAFLARESRWKVVNKMQLIPSGAHDGFYMVVLREG